MVLRFFYYESLVREVAFVGGPDAERYDRYMGAALAFVTTYPADVDKTLRDLAALERGDVTEA